MTTFQVITSVLMAVCILVPLAIILQLVKKIHSLRKEIRHINDEWLALIADTSEPLLKKPKQTELARITLRGTANMAQYKAQYMANKSITPSQLNVLESNMSTQLIDKISADIVQKVAEHIKVTKDENGNLHSSIDIYIQKDDK